MKIVKITEEEDWIVDFEPNWFEKLFGIKPKTEVFRQTFNNYEFGGGAVYRRQNGSNLGNNNWIGVAIDKHRRKW